MKLSSSSAKNQRNLLELSKMKLKWHSNGCEDGTPGGSILEDRLTLAKMRLARPAYTTGRDPQRLVDAAEPLVHGIEGQRVPMVVGRLERVGQTARPYGF